MGQPKTMTNRVGIISLIRKFSFSIQKSTFIMKKAKIMLMAITVIGIAGGALAFKATEGNTPLFSCDVVAQKCSVPAGQAIGFGTLFILGVATTTYDTLVGPDLTTQPCVEPTDCFTTLYSRL
jgi:type 1 fimbria pilin